MSLMLMSPDYFHALQTVRWHQVIDIGGIYTRTILRKNVFENVYSVQHIVAITLIRIGS